MILSGTMGQNIFTICRRICKKSHCVIYLRKSLSAVVGKAAGTVVKAEKHGYRYAFASKKAAASFAGLFLM